ncbi:uncharacterized protein METZ01_LOCUS105844 [marine metagenome]|uniref:Bacteriophage T4 Gp59 helicase assembly protein N-terminal domain-containing protein n=1 Tax=marine metagenome TaxID=408172 RepID=A0A381WKE6_9ZZZZ|tara:strand:+ start:2016 stop:2612 length:597 start_codon:yes stop_codon:yes gene_type:complete
MSSREGFDSYQLYLGVKLHFNSESYDFVKYNGKVKADLPSFLKRNDRFHFGKLARLYKSELLDFYVANLSLKDKWVGDLLDNESKKVYLEWKKRNQRLTYQFEQDVTKLLEKKNIQEVLTVNKGQHPYLLKQFLGKKISLETMCILDEITEYSKKWNTLITETLIYPETINKINKYKAFISFNKNTYKQKLIQLCKTN